MRRLFRKKSEVRLTAVAFIVGLSVTSLATVAFASITYSNTKNYGPYDGYSYSNEAAVNNDSSIYGWAYAWTQNGLNAPAGYIGAEAQLFESNGTLCKTTSYSYTPSAEYGWDNWTSGSCGTMYYYGRGWTRAYTGNGYYSIVTDISPNLYGS